MYVHVYIRMYNYSVKDMISNLCQASTKIDKVRQRLLQPRQCRGCRGSWTRYDTLSLQQQCCPRQTYDSGVKAAHFLYS